MSFDLVDYTVTETDANFQFDLTIVRMGDPSVNFQISLQTHDGTALSKL